MVIKGLQWAWQGQGHTPACHPSYLYLYVPVLPAIPLRSKSTLRESCTLQIYASAADELDKFPASWKPPYVILCSGYNYSVEEQHVHWYSMFQQRTCWSRSWSKINRRANWSDNSVLFLGRWGSSFATCGTDGNTRSYSAPATRFGAFLSLLRHQLQSPSPPCLLSASATDACAVCRLLHNSVHITCLSSRCRRSLATMITDKSSRKTTAK